MMCMVLAVVASLVTFTAVVACEADCASALRALRGLQAAVETKVALPEYVRRLADTTATVNEYLRTAPHDAAGPAIQRALAQYQLAKSVWEYLEERKRQSDEYTAALIRGRGYAVTPAVATDDYLAAVEREGSCPHLTTLRRELAGKPVILLSTPMALVWRCATEELQRAELAAK